MARSRLSIALVGLPNVGKSSLFNAITKLQVPAENYPFCTIEPHKGTVLLQDERLHQLSRISGSEKIISSTVDFVDVAGLVKHASKGEGLGNQFLGTIRETGVVCHVLRCFEDDNVTHVHGEVNPVEDYNVVFTELLLADIQSCETYMAGLKKRLKTADKEIKQCYDVLQRVYEHLGKSRPVSSCEVDEHETTLLKPYVFLTQKPVCFVANVDESELGGKNKWISPLQELAKQVDAMVVELCVSLEGELAVLDDDDKKDYLASYGIDSSGLDKLACLGFELLGLQTFLTTGEKETRSWIIPKQCSAPQAAGVIHTDFEPGFIRANVIGFTDLMDCGSLKVAKDRGVLRQEGKEYLMQDGDVVEFLTSS